MTACSQLGTFVGDGDNAAAPEQVKVASVTPNFLTMLGVQPAMGRLFTPDERAGGRAALILSHELWMRRFGGDPQIIGKGVPFQGRATTVVGVMPAGFRLYFPHDSNVPAEVGAFFPYSDNIYKGSPTLYYIRVLARMKPGVTAAAAQQDLDQVAAGIRQTLPVFAAEKMQLTLSPLQADAVSEVRPGLIALEAGAGFVLLICAVNLANLLLARSSDRRKEFAIRASLGAPTSRILRQLAIESTLLISVAGAAGA